MTRGEFTKKKEFNRWIDKMNQIEIILMRNCEEIENYYNCIIFKWFNGTTVSMFYKDFPNDGIDDKELFRTSEKNTTGI